MMKAGKIGWFAALGVLMLLLACCGGSLKNYGHYVPDTGTTRLFESGAQSAEYLYYYCGPESSPTAMLGLKKEYILEERLWQKIDPDSPVYGKLLSGMQNRALRVGRSLKGYLLYGPDNTPVGVWYSVFEATPVVHIIGEKIVEVIGPPSDLYERYEDKEDTSH